MARNKEFVEGFPPASYPSDFQEGDRVRLPDGRLGQIMARDLETRHWKVKTSKQWAFVTVSDWDLKEANKRGA